MKKTCDIFDRKKSMEKILRNEKKKRKKKKTWGNYIMLRFVFSSNDVIILRWVLSLSWHSIHCSVTQSYLLGWHTPDIIKLARRIPRALSPSGFAFNGFLDCTLPYFFFFFSPQEIVRCIYSLVQVIDSGGGNGYISRYTNYRIIHLCLFPRISKSKILTARSLARERNNNDRTVWTGTRSRELLNHRVTKSRF